MSHLGARVNWPAVVTADLIDLVCGEKLGDGIGREVYVFALDPTKVLKFEYATESFQNAREWYIWNDLKEASKWNKWLAPCYAISSCGQVLVQARTTPPPRDYAYPRTLPAFLTDTKNANYGLFEGRLVCHDYGTCVSEYRLKQRKAHWWD